MLSGCSVRPVPPPEATEKYFFAVLNSPFFISTCHRMLETSGVGGVAGNRNIYTFMAHNCNTFVYIICSIAFYSSTFTFGIGFFPNDFQFAGIEIIFGFYMRKTIDTGNHCCSIFAKAVQNYAQGLNSYFIGCLCNTDSTLSSRKRFMACQEAEAIGFFAEQHGCQITVAKANFSLVSYRTGNAECLQADADSFGCISCFFAALLRAIAAPNV